MNNFMLGKAMMLTFAGLGIRIENQKEIENGIETYISVPEQSYCLDASGNEMSGMFLAKRINQKLKEMGIKDIVLKARVRNGEYWTKEMDKKAQEDMMKIISRG